MIADFHMNNYSIIILNLLKLLRIKSAQLVASAVVSVRQDNNLSKPPPRVKQCLSKAQPSCFGQSKPTFLHSSLNVTHSVVICGLLGTMSVLFTDCIYICSHLINLIRRDMNTTQSIGKEIDYSCCSFLFMFH